MEAALIPTLNAVEPLLAAIRPHLTPYTSSLPAQISTPIQNLITPECYETIVSKLDPAASPACTQLAISKTLGIGIVSMSALVKLPQLLKLISSGSARGVSFSSYALETIAYVITLAYNSRQGNPLSTYGEIGILAVQNIAVSLLVLHFGGKQALAAVWVALLAGGAWALFNGDVVDPAMLAMCQAATIPLGLASKVPQIYGNWKMGGTGVLSAFAVFNYLLGSLARVFTTLAEVDDPVILYGFVGGAALNAVLALQMLWYWNSGSKATGNGKAKKHYPASGNKGGKKRA